MKSFTNLATTATSTSAATAVARPSTSPTRSLDDVSTAQAEFSAAKSTLAEITKVTKELENGPFQSELLQAKRDIFVNVHEFVTDCMQAERDYFKSHRHSTDKDEVKRACKALDILTKCDMPDAVHEANDHLLAICKAEKEITAEGIRGFLKRAFADSDKTLAEQTVEFNKKLDKALEGMLESLEKFGMLCKHHEDFGTAYDSFDKSTSKIVTIREKLIRELKSLYISSPAGSDTHMKAGKAIIGIRKSEVDVAPSGSPDELTRAYYFADVERTRLTNALERTDLPSALLRTVIAGQATLLTNLQEQLQQHKESENVKSFKVDDSDKNIKNRATLALELVIEPEESKLAQKAGKSLSDLKQAEELVEKLRPKGNWLKRQFMAWKNADKLDLAEKALVAQTKSTHEAMIEALDEVGGHVRRRAEICQTYNKYTEGAEVVKAATKALREAHEEITDELQEWNNLLAGDPMADVSEVDRRSLPTNGKDRDALEKTVFSLHAALIQARAEESEALKCENAAKEAREKKANAEAQIELLKPQEGKLQGQHTAAVAAVGEKQQAVTEAEKQLAELARLVAEKTTQEQEAKALLDQAKEDWEGLEAFSIATMVANVDVTAEPFKPVWEEFKAKEKEHGQILQDLAAITASHQAAEQYKRAAQDQHKLSEERERLALDSLRNIQRRLDIEQEVVTKLNDIALGALDIAFEAAYKKYKEEGDKIIGPSVPS